MLPVNGACRATARHSLAQGQLWAAVQSGFVLTASPAVEFCFDFYFNVLHRLAEGPMATYSMFIE